MLPICIEDDGGEYRAPVLTGDGANAPGIWGLRSQKAMRELIDTGVNSIILPGPGGFEINLSPGSRVVRCDNAVSSHMMVPVSEIEGRSMKSTTKWMLYGTLGEHSNTKNDERFPHQDVKSDKLPGVPALPHGARARRLPLTS